MSMLAKVVSGKQLKPHFLICYGPDGVGKTTFGASAPKAIFLGSEEGSGNLDVSRFPGVKSLADFCTAIQELTDQPHAFESLVIDSADWLEPLIWAYVCEKAGCTLIEEAYGGFGKGYVAANKIWLGIVEQLKELRDKRKLNIIILAHSQVKAFNDPTQLQPYDRYSLKLNEKAAALLREAVDCVLFANYEVAVKKGEGGNKTTRALGDGTRLLYTERRPSFDAKNRFGLPAVINFSWDDYTRFMSGGETADRALAVIKELLPQIADEALRATMLDYAEKAAGNVGRLNVILNRVRNTLI